MSDDGGSHSDADFDDAHVAVGHVGRCVGPTLIGEDCRLQTWTGEWRLDGGWRAFFEDEEASREGVYRIKGSEGSIVTLPEDFAQRAQLGAVLVVVTGGADLDARWLGEMTAVIAVDGGSLLLEGTVVKGAVFVTEQVDVGSTGRVEYRLATLRWATDTSLRRTRLAPGTRAESTL